MSAIRIILDEKFAINNRFRVVLYALRVPVSEKFPNGIKAKFVLIDVQGNFPKLLVNNHEPFGFHMHTALPEDKDVRVELPVIDHNAALALFYKEVERILKNDQG
ncbi:MAG: hypothetical protein ABIQ95_16070 [Bdellovibrionia bacterium]